MLTNFCKKLACAHEFLVEWQSDKNGDVAKWSKAVVCKTIIHGFESHRRLHFNY